MHKRLYLQHITTGDLTLTSEESHYLRDVLRLQPGTHVLVFDGRGGEALADVVSVGRKGVVIRIHAEAIVAADPHAAETNVRLTVGVAQPKGQRADWLVEKLTEIGAAQIVWLHCARSVSQTTAEGQKHARWLRLMEAAAQQCNRSRLPQLVGVASVAELMAYPATHRVIAATCATLPLLTWAKKHVGDVDNTTSTPLDVVLAIGPEGDFVSDEEACAAHAGAAAVTLGPHILRTETAAIAAAAMIMGASRQ